MTLLKKSLLAIVSAACCSIAAADTIYGTANLSTAYTISISGWAEIDQEDVYVPPHSTLTVTDSDYHSDTLGSQYMLQEEGALYNYWPDYFAPELQLINDSDEGAYYHLELFSSVYTDPYDVIHCPASSASVSYRIDPIEEEPLP